MSKKQYYFENENDTVCYDLKHFVLNAKREQIDHIQLHRAIKDDELPDLHFCGYEGVQVERNECSKKNCQNYESKSGRGACQYRGDLYFASCGKVTFDVNKEFEKLNK